MIEVGRVVVKIAGRDAGCKAIIIDILDDKYVLIDGETRRRKVNVLHIEPLSNVLKIKKGASHDEVAKALDELGLKARITKPKPSTQKPLKKRKTPEQLKAQKEEKKKLRDIFKPKRKEELAEKKEESLEAKAGLEAKEEKSQLKEEKTKQKKSAGSKEKHKTE